MRPARMPSNRVKVLPWYYTDRAAPSRAADEAEAISTELSADERDVCAECGEGIHLEYAGSDMGVLAGASVWEHDRWRSQMLDPHDPHPEWPVQSYTPNDETPF